MTGYVYDGLRCTVDACNNLPAFCTDHADYDLSGTEERDALRKRLQRAEELLLWLWDAAMPPAQHFEHAEAKLAEMRRFNEETRRRRGE